jgi:SAM-dependent methyltransferase
MMRPSSEGAAWSSYWSGAQDGGAAVRGEGSAASFTRFWTGVFEGAFRDYAAPRHADLACGAGTVSAISTSIAKRMGVSDALFLLADYSLEAVGQACAALRDAKPVGVVSDGGLPLLRPSSMDIVTSQFGLEYAADPAFGEAWRSVAPGGRMTALVHITDGPIHRECRANLDLLDLIQSARILPRLMKLFPLVRRVEGGAKGKAKAERLERNLIEDMNKLASQIQAAPGSPAASFAFQLLRDSATLYQRRAAYAPTDADQWLQHQVNELQAYRLRMSSMIDAAKTRDELVDLLEPLDAEEAPDSRIGEFSLDGESQACAWIVTLTRSAG